MTHEVNAGDQFGDLVIVDPWMRVDGKTYMVCKCTLCGRNTKIWRENVLRGNTRRCRSCGRLRAQQRMRERSVAVRERLIGVVLESGARIVGVTHEPAEYRVTIECPCGRRHNMLRRSIGKGRYSKSTGKCDDCRLRSKSTTYGGKTIQELAADFGISKQGMYARIRRYGLEAAVAMGRPGEEVK